MGQAATPATVRGEDGRVYGFGYKGVIQVETVDGEPQILALMPGWLYEVSKKGHLPSSYVHVDNRWIKVVPGSFNATPDRGMVR